MRIPQARDEQEGTDNLRKLWSHSRDNRKKEKGQSILPKKLKNERS